MSGISFSFSGLEELEKAITEAYSGTKARAIRKEALNAGGDLVVETLKQNFEAFKDKGYSQAEIMRTNARTSNDVESLRIGWNGPHNRWRIVHLNEFGYTRNGRQYTPRGFGVIEKTVRESQRDYFDTIEKKMRDRL